MKSKIFSITTIVLLIASLLTVNVNALVTPQHEEVWTPFGESAKLISIEFSSFEGTPTYKITVEFTDGCQQEMHLDRETSTPITPPVTTCNHPTNWFMEPVTLLYMEWDFPTMRFYYQYTDGCIDSYPYDIGNFVRTEYITNTVYVENKTVEYIQNNTIQYIEVPVYVDVPTETIVYVEKPIEVYYYHNKTDNTVTVGYRYVDVEDADFATNTYTVEPEIKEKEVVKEVTKEVIKEVTKTVEVPKVEYKTNTVTKEVPKEVTVEVEKIKTVDNTTTKIPTYIWIIVIILAIILGCVVAMLLQQKNKTKELETRIKTMTGVTA